MAVLQRLVGQTESASNESWKSLIDEDRLLTRVEILESQLSTYGKSMNEDKLREETKRLMEEKEEYQVNTWVFKAFKMVARMALKKLFTGCPEEIVDTIFYVCFFICTCFPAVNDHIMLGLVLTFRYH